ncbi:MAG: hypothetical protein WA791_19015 [Rhodomicrobium sp.]
MRSIQIGFNQPLPQERWCLRDNLKEDDDFLAQNGVLNASSLSDWGFAISIAVQHIAP